jgi:putative restriction endonuclease
MRFWLGVTDPGWFEFLRARRAPEANFWQPSAVPLANFLQPGTPFLFKLRGQGHVVGGGCFVRFTTLPVSLAWAAFREDNGVSSLGSLLQRLTGLGHGPITAGSPIACNVLAEPFFFDESDWIPAPISFKRNIVRGKTYDSEDAEGRALWDAVRDRLAAGAYLPAAEDAPEPGAMYGEQYLTRGRLGQGAFRILVTDAWHRRCAVSGERTLPALEAAHIMPYAKKGPHRINNGLLLRADLHRLFDDGYVTVESARDEYRFLVSKRVREEFENGREYYRFHGKPLSHLPEAQSQRPGRDFLDWHNRDVFNEGVQG